MTRQESATCRKCRGPRAAVATPMEGVVIEGNGGCCGPCRWRYMVSEKPNTRQGIVSVPDTEEENQ